jgi:hypothetical protein
MTTLDMARGTFDQRRGVRRSALVWTLIAVAFYVGFIILTLVRASR